MFGQLFGDFSLSLGDFLTKTSGHPVPVTYDSLEYYNSTPPYLIYRLDPLY